MQQIQIFSSRFQTTCFRLASLIFRTCLCCVYSLSFPGHFGNSNPSLSLITHTTHSTSGLGLPEWLICRAFYCSHIVGVVNDCVARHCFLLRGSTRCSHQRRGELMRASHGCTSRAILSTRFFFFCLSEVRALFKANGCVIFEL